MTRLTDEQIAAAWDNFGDGNVWPFMSHGYQTRLQAFASRIAAIAVQEVERGVDPTYKTAFLAEAKRGDRLHAEVATLTAQLAEVTKERDAAVRSDRLARLWVEGARALLATAKREALTKCADDADLGFSSCGKAIREYRDREYPATPSGEGVKVTCADFGYCVDAFERCESGKECFGKPATPSPEAREVPSGLLLPTTDDLGVFGRFNVKITPADAKRIVDMAQRNI